MIIESILIIVFALGFDFAFGDPKNRFHPTAWIGTLVSKLVPVAKSNSSNKEKITGIIIVVTVTSIVASALVGLDLGLNLISVEIIYVIASIIIGSILLKTTIAIRGMEHHAISVLNSIEQNNLESAREHLSMIVKRNTKKLDKNHILSGVIESVSENTVDGITGPMFYFALFGLPGAFVYRTINTFDSMIGYKNKLFANLGWFGANCDKILNLIPARLTGLIMILSSMILGYDWKNSYQVMLRDGKKLESPNAGYPMAALAGALGTRLEKIDHYSIGNGDLAITKQHVKSTIVMMKVTSILFCGIITVPIIVVLSYFGWWIHA